MKQRLLEVLFVATPKVLGGVLTIALNAIVMRFLGPADFGVFALCTAAIVLFDSIVGAAVDNSMFKLVQSERDRGSAHTLSIEQSALFVKIGLWMAAGLALAAFAEEVSRRWLHQDGRVSLVTTVVLAAGAVLVFRSLLAHWQVRERFAVYGALDMLHTVLKFGSIGVLLLLAAHPQVEALVALLALAPICVTVSAMALGGLPLLRVRPALRNVLRVADVSKWFLMTFGLSVLLNRLDLFLLAELSTITEVGIYSGGQVYAIIPEMLGSLLSVVFVPRIYAYWRDGRLEHLGRSVLYIGAGFATLALAAAWAGRPLLALIFPPAFLASTEVFLILLPGTLAGMIAFPLVIPFLMFARPRAIFMLDLLTLPLVAALYGWLIASHGAVGAAWAATATRLTKVAVMHMLAWQALRRSPRPPAPDPTR